MPSDLVFHDQISLPISKEHCEEHAGPEELAASGDTRSKRRAHHARDAVLMKSSHAS